MQRQTHTRAPTTVSAHRNQRIVGVRRRRWFSGFVDSGAYIPLICLGFMLLIGGIFVSGNDRPDPPPPSDVHSSAPVAYAQGLDPADFGLSETAREVVEKAHEERSTFEDETDGLTAVSDGQPKFVDSGSATLTVITRIGEKMNNYIVFADR